MESVIIASLIGSAATFAPTPVAKKYTAANASKNNLDTQPLLLHLFTPILNLDLALGRALFVINHNAATDGNGGNDSNDAYSSAYSGADGGADGGADDMNGGTYCVFGLKEIIFVPNVVVNSSNCIGQ